MNNADRILRLILDIGEQMLISGAEISRVENTVLRICASYNFKRADVFCITSMITACVELQDGSHITQTRRIYIQETDMGRIEKLNLLSRDICSNKPEISEIEKRLNCILMPDKRFRFSVLIGYVITSLSLCIYLGGNFYDGVISAIISVVIYFINSLFKLKSMNIILYTVLCSALAGTLAIFFVKSGLGVHADKIMIGDVMLLIPGLSTINSVRDLLCGDIMSGIMRLTAAIITAVSIACGFAIPLIVFG